MEKHGKCPTASIVISGRLKSRNQDWAHFMICEAETSPPAGHYQSDFRIQNYLI